MFGGHGIKVGGAVMCLHPCGLQGELGGPAQQAGEEVQSEGPGVQSRAGAAGKRRTTGPLYSLREKCLAHIILCQEVSLEPGSLGKSHLHYLLAV